jgi:hypothetical protein
MTLSYDFLLLPLSSVNLVNSQPSNEAEVLCCEKLKVVASVFCCGKRYLKSDSLSRVESRMDLQAPQETIMSGVKVFCKIKMF